jgi:hypothetical protein
MKADYRKTLYATVALALVLPGGALAEVTAPEVWDNWKSYFESLGQSVTVGQQETAEGALVLQDVTFSMDFPEGTMSGTLGALEFRERSDGTVAISMSPDFPLSISTAPQGGESMYLPMIIRQTGTSIVASGDSESIIYDYLAPAISGSIDRVMIDGEELDATVSWELTDIKGRYVSNRGTPSRLDSRSNAAGLNFEVVLNYPGQAGRFTMKGSGQDLVSEYFTVIPEGFDAQNPGAMFNSAFSAQGTIGIGPSSYEISAENSAGSFQFAARSESGSFDFALADGSLSYGTTATNSEYSITTPAIPFPQIALKLAESAMRITMPLAPSDEPRDFGVLLKLAGLQVDEAIWSMFDPGRILPRDPANIIFDVAGRMRWLIDISDPAAGAMAEETDEVPAELYDLKVNDITFSMAGAEITGGGSFVFDNSDLETFDGLPAPTGALDFRITGAYALLDNLVAMGLLPPDEITSSRMMLSVFTSPTENEDTLTTKVEITGSGGVFVNGRRFQ